MLIYFGHALLRKGYSYVIVTCEKYMCGKTIKIKTFFLHMLRYLLIKFSFALSPSFLNHIPLVLVYYLVFYLTRLCLKYLNKIIYLHIPHPYYEQCKPFRSHEIISYNNGYDFKEFCPE